MKKNRIKCLSIAFSIVNKLRTHINYSITLLNLLNSTDYQNQLASICIATSNYTKIYWIWWYDLVSLCFSLHYKQWNAISERHIEIFVYSTEYQFHSLSSQADINQIASKAFFSLIFFSMVCPQLVCILFMCTSTVQFGCSGLYSCAYHFALYTLDVDEMQHIGLRVLFIAIQYPYNEREMKKSIPYIA